MFYLLFRGGSVSSAASEIRSSRAGEQESGREEESRKE